MKLTMMLLRMRVHCQNYHGQYRPPAQPEFLVEAAFATALYLDGGVPG